MRKLILPILMVLVVLVPASAQQVADFRPAPETVFRWEKGYRYSQSGWTVLHIEGGPYERGYQHGRLLASEIAAHVRCYSQVMNYKTPTETWKTVRMFTNALFLRKFDQETLEEMKGIADGAAAAGAQFDGRPIDILDIATINCQAELDSLDEANAATPTGLESKIFPDPRPQAKPQPRGEHCSAFAATGPATADGKVVFGHITMWSLYPANFYNVWLDIQPTSGHRIVMCSYPGGIQSGMDYYINDAGLLINETTIKQTRFNANGMTCASRIRKAIQYADNIDKAVEILLKDNNGLYTNEWLLADINTGEIAMFELGTYKHKLWRSSKNEWFGDTPGFYWGCNNIKDMDVRLETIASSHAKPANVIFRPQPRDVKWQKMYHDNKGKIGLDFAKEAFTSPALATNNASLDAKYTNSAMARELKSWAVFGPPTGKTWNPRKDEKDKYPEIKALVTNPWTILGTMPPARDAGAVAQAISDTKPEKARGPGFTPDTAPAWRGTLLPQSDADLWLAIAFAEYEKMVATERAAIKRGDDAAAARTRLDKSVTALRKTYQSANLDVALAELKSNTMTDEWYRAASSKGVILLHQLRTDVGGQVFDKAMDDFGMQFGGQRVTSQQFQTHFERATGRQYQAFFDTWLKTKGLPTKGEQ
jgi:hypothetical protein